MTKWSTLFAAYLFVDHRRSGGGDIAHRAERGPDTLDPTQSRTFASGVVRAALCDRLFDIGLELEILPQLATEWGWTDDKKGLVIKLRRGVKFQDSEPFDAAAVKYNIERHLTMPGSTLISEINAITEFEIIDNHTAKLVLSTPFAPLPAQLASPAGRKVSLKGGAGSRGEFRFRPGLRRLPQIRRAPRPGPHRRPALRRLLRQGQDQTRSHCLSVELG